ncbi:MAG: hypothetical protein E2O39_14655 [Planctomycetota bacterium]|nr:MAG: hypothetical protein E2O39_14655 [Planctomycetota bacterium]
MRPLHPALLALSLALAACAPRSDDAREAGFRALHSREFAHAAASFERARAQRSPGAADYVETTVGYCSALAHVDPAQVVPVFRALGDRATERDFSMVAAELVSARELEFAVALLEAGVPHFPGSTKMLQIKDRVEGLRRDAQLALNARVADSVYRMRLHNDGYGYCLSFLNPPRGDLEGADNPLRPPNYYGPLPRIGTPPIAR